MEQTTLTSGVTVVTEALTSVRSVTLGMWIAVGSRDEAPIQAGCSHFLEHLLFKGTRTRSARDIAEALDRVGGELNAFTSKEQTCFHARVLDRDVPLALDVLGDMLVDAQNAPLDVEAERQVVLSELEIHNDTPDDLVHTDVAALILGEHPLGAETLGSFESVSALDRDTIHDYYLSHYRPEDVVVAAAGNVTHEDVVRLADDLLGDLGRPGTGHSQRHAPTEFGAHNISIRHRPTEQAHVAFGVVGLSHSDDDRWALRVLDVVLGGGMSSRLFQHIREERGLAYSTYTYASSFSDGGLFAAYAGTSPAQVDDVVKLLRDELDNAADSITDGEIDRAKGALAGQTVLALEDTASRMARIGRQVSSGEPVISVDEALQRVQDVTLDDVQRVARRVLGQPKNLAIVGPFTPEERSRFEDVVA